MMRGVDAGLGRFNRWLASPAGFIQATILTIAWTVAAVLGVDEHGFWFLYVATAFSFVTQFNLAIFASRAGASARAADDRAYKTLQRMEASDDADGEILLSLKQALENQKDVLGTLIVLTQAQIQGRTELVRAIATLDEQVDALNEVAKEARDRHQRNEELIRRLAEVFNDET